MIMVAWANKLSSSFQLRFHSQYYLGGSLGAKNGDKQDVSATRQRAGAQGVGVVVGGGASIR